MLAAYLEEVERLGQVVGAVHVTPHPRDGLGRDERVGGQRREARLLVEETQTLPEGHRQGRLVMVNKYFQELTFF